MSGDHADKELLREIESELDLTNNLLKKNEVNLDNIDWELSEVNKGLEKLSEVSAATLEVLLDIRGILRTPQGIKIRQFGGHMAITGITAGGAAGVFGETPTPAGSVFPAGTTFTWTSDVADIVLTPDADGTSVSATAPQTETAQSFNLTCTSSTGVSGSGVVPIFPFVPPPPTGLVIDQIS